MISNSTGVAVNAKNPILKLTPTGQPIVECPDGLTIALPDVPWGRWYARTHFSHMSGTPEGLTWYAKHDPLKLEHISLLRSTLRSYQVLAVNRMIMGNCCLFLPMGVGKSFISIAFAMWMFQRGLGNVFLVVCPPSVFVTWEDEIELHTTDYNICVAHGAKKEKALAALRAHPITKPTFVLTSYETLEHIREKLQSLPICSVFFDESSKIKNIEAQRTQSAHKLINSLNNPRRFCLSGTPSTKTPLGLFSQYEILGKGFSGHPSFLSFENRYAVTKTFATVRLPHGKITSLEADADSMNYWLSEHRPPNSSASYLSLGYKFEFKPTKPHDIRVLNYHKRNVKFVNQDELHATTQRMAYTVEKTDVLPDLPAKTRVRRSIELSDEQRKAYNDILNTCRTELENTTFSFESNSPYAKLHQIANGYLIGADHVPVFFKTQPKLHELRQIIEEAGDQKIVCWAPFRPLIANTAAFLKSEGISCVELHGGISPDKRRDVVHEFQNPGGAQILLANPAVGGLGLNLVSSCLEVFIANWFSPDVRIQAEDRLWRSGQTKPVTVVDLVTKGTLEARVLRIALNEVKAEQRLIAMSVLMGKEA